MRSKSSEKKEDLLDKEINKCNNPKWENTCHVGKKKGDHCGWNQRYDHRLPLGKDL